jgi:ABC-2 type transport system ATP-binding protein
MNRPISEYSHGMKQKICLMASLIHNPKIWILDEPTVGLDIIVYEVLLKMIRDFANNGKTVFITSHSIDLVAKVCDRVAIVNNGVVELLIDLNKEPLKRRDLNKIFFKLYEQDIN